jgi:hypothetical protein
VPLVVPPVPDGRPLGVLPARKPREITRRDLVQPSRECDRQLRRRVCVTEESSDAIAWPYSCPGYQAEKTPRTVTGPPVFSTTTVFRLAAETASISWLSASGKLMFPASLDSVDHFATNTTAVPAAFATEAARARSPPSSKVTAMPSRAARALIPWNGVTIDGATTCALPPPDPSTPAPAALPITATEPGPVSGRTFRSFFSSTVSATSRATAACAGEVTTASGLPVSGCSKIPRANIGRKIRRTMSSSLLIGTSQVAGHDASGQGSRGQDPRSRAARLHCGYGWREARRRHHLRAYMGRLGVPRDGNRLLFESGRWMGCCRPYAYRARH